MLLERTKNTLFAFFVKESKKSSFPLFKVSFINHSKRTILLNGAHLRFKQLKCGLSGIPFPILLKSSALYRIPISYEEERGTFIFKDQLQVPAEQAFKFQIDGRNVLYFTFLLIIIRVSRFQRFF